jgi:hypothetical protein
MRNAYTLFIGNKNGKKNGGTIGAPQPEGKVVVSKDELKAIRDKTEKGQKSDAIVISQ